jgi:hypothetical protein
VVCVCVCVGGVVLCVVCVVCFVCGVCLGGVCVCRVQGVLQFKVR